MTGEPQATEEANRVCPMCGEEMPRRFRFCGLCGTAFPDAPAAIEVRKEVTVLFCDLKGSTSLGESVDSETLRELISTYFHDFREAIERHEGTIDKFLGDAVMAVWGVPKVREDDALRAVRAALDMKERLDKLNDELEHRYGVRLANRTGVNTGELVAGAGVAGHGLVIGDAVNVAARLEQNAPLNEILIGERTYQLVRDNVEVQEVEPLELKGKAERVRAFRLISVSDGEVLRRHHDRPLVGREEELAALRDAFAVAAEGRPRLATVLGHAGMGKSRLTAEFMRSAADEAHILRGRCLPYGRGITFWPLVEIVREAAGIDEDDPVELGLVKLAALADEDAVAERVASVVGLSKAQFSVEEIVWATRKLLEALARERPIVVVFDDIHWAEPTLLDLIRHLGESSEGPVLILCLARHDLLDHHPEWGEATDAPVISLQPLSEEAMGRIVDNVLGTGDVTDEVRSRILEAADGNPLFVEQMLSMLIDEGFLREEEGGWRPTGSLADVAVPPTIQALLAARVEKLDREQRHVVEPASVAGFQFAQTAIRTLVEEPLRPQVQQHLESLTTKQLMRPDPDGPFDEDGYRFEHLLIRDAAYKRLLKKTRAILHQRFVEWSDALNRERGREDEFQEILGYHLEQAYRYLAELGPLDEDGRRLGARAAERLASAGRRAFGRGDMPAAAGLLQRAVDLIPVGDRRRLELLPDLGEALVDTGEFQAAGAFLNEAIEGADGMGDERLGARAQVVHMLLRGQAGDPGSWAEEAVRRAQELLPIFERAGDEVGLAATYRLIAWAQGTACRFGNAADAAQRAVEHAMRADDERQRRWASAQYGIAALWGPTPVEDAIASCEEIVELAQGDRRTEGLVKSLLARLEAMRGEFEAARALTRDARAMLEDMGRSVVTASTSLDSCGVEVLAGDLDGAERDLRRDYAALEEMGEKYLLSTVAAELAGVLAEKGEDDEAERYTAVAQELADEDDLTSQALWRWVRARILARRGEFDDAVALANEAIDLLGETDSLISLADALLALSEISELAGRPKDAAGHASAALDLYERKGDVVSTARARERVARLSGPGREPDAVAPAGS